MLLIRAAADGYRKLRSSTIISENLTVQRSLSGKEMRYSISNAIPHNPKSKKHPYENLVNTGFVRQNLYSGNPLYPQKAKSFILTYFLFQGILGLPSRSWLTLSFFSLISRYSSIFKAFSMVLSKRKRPHRTFFPLYKVLIFSLFYSFPRLKIFAF